MGDDTERRIDDLYVLPLDRFTPERDALSKELAGSGDREAAARVKGLRKPVVAAWALNLLAREDPEAVAELEDLGRRLRDAQRRALSGGDAEPLRLAIEERRAVVARLAGRARQILEREGVGGAAHDDVAGTLDAAAVDEEAAAALRAGRLVRPMRPPAGFGDPATLTVLPGGRKAAEPALADEATAQEDARARARLVRELRRELASAEARQRRAEEAVARARERVEEADRRRGEARDRLREAEAAQRGAALEAKRVAAALAKLERSS
jgi:hypothetical protein